MRMTNVTTLKTYFNTSVTAAAIAADDISTGDGAVTIATSSGNITIDAQAGDADIIFKGTDSSSDITALTLDMSAAGAATFNDKVVATELDISGNMDIDGTSNLDAVDIDGAVQIDGTLTTGVDDTGVDVKFFGATSGSFLLWDESDDALELTDSTKVKIGDGGDMEIYHDGSNSYITNSTGALKLATETSGIAITLGHSTSEVTVADNLTVTGDLTINGTTTTVNSTTMTVDDPTITLGGDSAPGSDDNKDRGVEFRYHDGSNAQIGFMGYDDSATGFTFLTAASNSSEVFSGTAAKLIAGELDISGDVAVGDDLSLDSDAAVLNFGADSDVNLTHVADTGLLLNAAMVIQFRDSGLTIGSNADGDLDIVSDGTAVDSINIESAGGITLDAGTDSSGITYEDDGTAMLSIINSSSDVIFTTKVQDKDFIIKGDDGGAAITALTIDMSAAGQFHFKDGTAALPILSNAGDTDTGLFFSAADTMAFSAGGTSQFTMADGVIAPVTDNDVDLGTSSLEFKDGYFDGTLHCDVLDLNGTEHTTIEDPTALAIALG